MYLKPPWSELNPMQEALALASNYGFQTARMTTTRRRWPLSLIYVCILLVHIHRRYNRSTGLLVFWASCHKQLRGPFTFCTHCSACSASCGFYYSPVSLSVQWQSQCLVLCKDERTPSVRLPLSFCILKAISSEFFGSAICFCFSYPVFLPPFCLASDFQ